MTITLHPGSVPLKTLETINRTGEVTKLNSGIEKAAERMAKIAASTSVSSGAIAASVTKATLPAVEA